MTMAATIRHHPLCMAILSLRVCRGVVRAQAVPAELPRTLPAAIGQVPLGVLAVPPFDSDCRALDHQCARPEQGLLGASRQFGHDVGRGHDRVDGTGALT
jgi:hypothetical protein